jgi:hypothetical protein
VNRADQPAPAVAEAADARRGFQVGFSLSVQRAHWGGRWGNSGACFVGTLLLSARAHLEAAAPFLCLGSGSPPGTPPGASAARPSG